MKKHTTLLISLLLVTSIFSQLNAQDEKSKDVQSIPLAFAQQDIINSKILNEERKINISLPQNFYSSSKHHTYPVLLLLENEFYQMTCGVVKHLSSVERMPETIVVSLVDEAVTPTIFTNGSDFWPKSWKQLEGENPDPFTKHLREELFPYLKSAYRANDFNIVMGLSWSSIYTLHAFTKEPNLFDAHIAIASGDILGMGYNEGESFIDLFEEDLKKGSEKKRYIYVTSSDADGNNYPMIKANLEELEKRLSPFRSDNFHFISKIFINEGHYDVVLPGLLEALNLIFPKEKWSAKYKDIIAKPGNAMVNIDDYFQKLSSEYGYQIIPRADRWNSVNRLSWIGPHLLREGKIEEAIEVINRWVEYRPKSSYALCELSKAYEAKNEIEKALSILKRAKEISVTNKELKEFSDRISQLQEKIK